MAGEFDTARVHLDVLGQDRELEFPVRVGPARVMDLLPTARELTDRITAIAVEHAAAQGKEVSCRRGCAACCRQFIPISAVEARSLADVVAALPEAKQREVRRRFAAALRRLEEMGLLQTDAPPGRQALLSSVGAGKAGWDDVSARYFAAQIACPFLEAESCGIYPDRPLACREYHVTTPAAWCAELSARVESTPRPVHMTEVLCDTANTLTGMTAPVIPLVLALEWAEAHGAPLQQEEDGEAMFWALLRQIQASDEAAAE